MGSVMDQPRPWEKEYLEEIPPPRERRILRMEYSKKATSNLDQLARLIKSLTYEEMIQLEKVYEKHEFSSLEFGGSLLQAANEILAGPENPDKM